MTPFIRDKTIESIKTFGFVDPLTVYHVGPPDPMGSYVIIDGEHRYLIGRDEFGMTEFPVMILEGITDTEARKLTIALNELHGQADPAKLGDLLKDLLEDLSMEELLQGIPFTADIVNSLVDLPAIPDMPQTPKGDAGAWVERLFRFPADVAQVVDGAIARAQARADIEDGQSIVDWQALERICADYLAE